jgi:hypothetical protein
VEQVREEAQAKAWPFARGGRILCFLASLCLADLSEVPEWRTVVVLALLLLFAQSLCCYG